MWRITPSLPAASSTSLAVVASLTLNCAAASGRQRSAVMGSPSVAGAAVAPDCAPAAEAPTSASCLPFLALWMDTVPSPRPSAR